jgi:hypothetical protein
LKPGPFSTTRRPQQITGQTIQKIRVVTQVTKHAWHFIHFF